MGFLPTGCEPLDEMLGGGINRGEVTLIYGEPGTGKTSLVLQCAFSCAKKSLKTIFIDSDRTFSPPRLIQMASSELSEISPLIFILKPSNFQEQLRLIESLDNYNLSSISLVIVDSVTTLYRVELSSAEKVFTLNRKLNWQLAYLNELARAYKTSFLLTSQVRSIIQRNSSDDRVEPVANRVLRFWAQKIIKLEPTSDPTIKEVILESGLNHMDNKTNCFCMLDKEGVVGIR